MTLCRQPWITSACACSSSAGSKLLSRKLRAPSEDSCARFSLAQSPKHL
jgi:hypothetical protein